ncbi:hypothetical protein ACQ86O_12245 [Serratia sp. L9]|uniref:hypothetical protein n=1 Tax=Serratia sp. L9 TaxID=3423946 RepID=UPI003D66441A
MMRVPIKKAIFAASGLLWAIASHSAWAVDCTNAVSQVPQNITVPLSPPTISAGEDIPIGTVIYQGNWITGLEGVLGCKTTSTEVGGTFWYNTSISIENAPQPLSSLTIGPFANGVYQTNIPGIGVAISRYSDRGPATQAAPAYKADDTDLEILVAGVNINPSIERWALNISLIKTGPLTPGNYVLNAADLPSTGVDWTNPRLKKQVSLVVAIDTRGH